MGGASTRVGSSASIYQVFENNIFKLNRKPSRILLGRPMRFSWVFMGFHGFSWLYMGFHGFPRLSELPDMIII
jgi:hypothetical protein